MDNIAQAIANDPNGDRRTWVDQPWQHFRCRNCGKLLMKVTPNPLKSRAAVEVRCRCKTLNYLMGPLD